MQKRFITGTGTGVGKTLVAAALCHQLRAAGRTVRALKPVVTGTDESPPDEGDPGVLATALGSRERGGWLDEIAPFRFRAPLAPSMAAAAERRALDFDALVTFCREAERGAEEVLLVEGVGGVMVPLVGRLTVLDWVQALNFPTILVAGSYLGTLSHTLTAIEVLVSRGMPIAGIVVSETEGATVGLTETVEALRSLTPGLPIHPVARLPGTDAWRRVPDLTALVW